MEKARFLLESASLRRIYPTLKQLTEDDLVTFQVEPQEGKPDRKVYSVTDEGEAVFLDWLRTPPEADCPFPELFSRSFFWGMLDKETLLAQISAPIDTLQRRLDWLQGREVDPPVGPCRPFVDRERVTDVWNQMMNYGRAETEAQIRWLKQTMKHIEDKWSD
jgi:DNA-binding PadR family transcriptional regulator